MRSIKQLFRNPPFHNSQDCLLVHCSHHKAGTVWFKNVLRAVSREYGLPFIVNDASVIPKGSSIFFDDHSKIDLSQISQPYKGSHMIRDPRDMVVSGYYYHLWTKERWANIPINRLGAGIEKYWPLLPVNKIGHLTYKEFLNSLSREEGINAEIQRATSTDFRDMLTWDYTNTNVFNFKYEDIVVSEETMFESIFTHFGFSTKAISKCVEIAMRFSFKNQTGRKSGDMKKESHLRSGKTEQWKKEFSEVNKTYFKNLHGEHLIQLGYELNLDW